MSCHSISENGLSQLWYSSWPWYNAALNIRNEGIRILQSNGGGNPVTADGDCRTTYQREKAAVNEVRSPHCTACGQCWVVHSRSTTSGLKRTPVAQTEVEVWIESLNVRAMYLRCRFSNSLADHREATNKRPPHPQDNVAVVLVLCKIYSRLSGIVVKNTSSLVVYILSLFPLSLNRNVTVSKALSALVPESLWHW